MKVILLRDVAKIGRRYEIVNVPDGFALNKLIPQGDAEPATPINVKRVTNMRQKDSLNKEKVIITLKNIVMNLGDIPLEVPMQANGQGHLFQSVHSEDIISAASKRGLIIPNDVVVFESPIKSTGSHKVMLKNQGETFTVEIIVTAK